MIGFDPWYFIIIGPGMLIALWASFKVKSTFAKYQNVAIGSRMSGAEIAEALLERAGIREVRVEPHQGVLTDHYDPKANVVRLSPDVYNGRSVSSIGVAAHEVGHAIQHAERYGPMALRQSLVLPANIGTWASYIVIILGVILQLTGLVWLGIILFSAVVLFQLVTLPVELNASSRAKVKLLDTGLITTEEAEGVGKVLNAAAMTYVAAVITSLLTLLYYVLRYTGGSRSDD
jgi:Zn-dependent membrane protease YugP